MRNRKFGTEADESTARALIVHHGAVHVVGHITGAMPGQTSAGGVDAVLRKFDLDGNVLWTRQFGTPGFDEATGVAADAKWIYVVGNTTGALTAQKNAGKRDVFVRKYDPEGNEVWTRQFGSPKYDDATAAALDATGIYVVGNTEGNLLGQKSAGQVDMFVVHFDPNGNLSWVRQIGSSGSDFATRIKVEIGGIYLAGHTDGALPGQTNQGSYNTFLLKLPPTAAAVKAGSENRPK